MGTFDGKDGKEPIAGETNQIRGQLGRGNEGEVLIFRYQGNSNTASGFDVQPATEVSAEGKTALIPADSFDNLSKGGFDLLVIPGTITTSTLPIIINTPPTDTQEYRRLQESLERMGLGQSGGLSFGELRLPTIPTYAAAVSTGRSFGESSTAAFDGVIAKASTVKFRIRINADIPPLEGTKGYVAWLNSQREAGKAYRTIICTYCHHQALEEQAVIVDGVLIDKKPCLCGARNFAVVEYLTTRAH